ncbi:hypothetical protein HPB47_010213 [Ixodes persulcatus]|uniref:Uncharacterized protein n=1 Tax=Ixodes persulcatus TaxID=34615 RepID=A0AC60NZW2_IXOPE|nr:hypothetical protein HPB47_010213 [Ixodes persulcatus]
MLCAAAVTAAPAPEVAPRRRPVAGIDALGQFLRDAASQARRVLAEFCDVRGWLYGVTDTGDSGLFPCEYVVPLSSRQPSVAAHTPAANGRTSVVDSGRDMRSPSEHASLLASAHNGTAWIEAKEHPDGLEEEVIEIPNGMEMQMADGKHSMLQFAMFNFRESLERDSCQRGWRLFSIVAAYFDCSENLRPYLFKFLETAAYDKRRAYHGTAMVCLQNLRKTFKYGGRKNVPSIEEIAAISAGRNSKRQIYRLPGGTERVINTKSTTVVEDIIDEICGILGVRGSTEMEEFSLYCIVEGDPLTMPLSREEYILDVTTELIKNGHVFYLIFCRSVWFFPLRLDNPLYVELIFNQVAPDYLEGLLLVQHQGRRLPDSSLVSARYLLTWHRRLQVRPLGATILLLVDEVKYLLPKPVLASKEVKPPHWVDLVQRNWPDMMALTNTEAKAQCLDILQRWPLFGSCFFAVKWIRNENTTAEHILALNREGIHFLDVVTHESIWMYPFSEVISTRKVRAEDGTLFLDMKCGNLMVQKITRIQTDQAHEISRLVRQYINIQLSHQGNQHGDAPQDVTLSRNLK